MRLSLVLGLMASSNIFLALISQWYVLTRLGAGIQTDALFAGMTLPQLALAIVTGSLTYVLVPLLATEDEKAFRQQAWGFFLGISGLFFLLAAILALTASYWVPVIVPGFSAEAKALTISLTRIQVIGMGLSAGLSVLWSVYHSRQRFLWAEFSPFFSNMIGLAFLVWALPRFGVAAAAWATVLRTGLQVAWLLPGLGRWQRPSFSAPVMTEAWRRIKPLLLGSAYYKNDILVDRLLASMAPSGSLSLLHVAQQLYNLSNQVICKAIADPMVPRLAVHAKNEQWQAFRQNYRQRLLWVTAVTGACVLVLVLVGEPLLQLLIGYGGITPENVTMVRWIMIALIGIFMGGAMGQILSTAFYAQGDTKTPTTIGVTGFTLGIALKIAGFLKFGVIGIAMGSSTYYVFNTILLVFFLERSLTARLAVGPGERVQESSA